MADIADEDEKLRRLLRDATADWLVENRKIENRGEFDLEKKIIEFAVTQPELVKLFNDIIAKVEISSGRILVLTGSWHDKFHTRTFNEAISVIKALSREPGRAAGYPVPQSPAPLPGRSTIRPSHPGPLPGKKN